MLNCSKLEVQFSLVNTSLAGGSAKNFDQEFKNNRDQLTLMSLESGWFKVTVHTTNEPLVSVVVAYRGEDKGGHPNIFVKKISYIYIYITFN